MEKKTAAALKCFRTGLRTRLIYMLTIGANHGRNVSFAACSRKLNMQTLEFGHLRKHEYELILTLFAQTRRYIVPPESNTKQQWEIRK